MTKKMKRKITIAAFTLLLAASVIMFGLWFKFGRSHQAHVIVVSGISSSGKTSLINELHTQLGDDSVIIRLDEFFQKIITEKATQLGWSPHSSISAWEYLREYVDDEVAQEVFDYEIRANMLNYQLMYNAITSAAQKYRYVLVDTMVECNRHYNELEKVCAKLPTKWVLLYCPLSVIADRLDARSDMASFVNSGISLAMYESFMAMFTPLKGVNWQALDVLNSTSTHMQLNSTIAHVLQGAPKKTLSLYKKHTEAFKQRFLSHFGLLSESLTTVPVYPAFRFDIVLNSNAASPQDLAKHVLEFK